ncbi:hypothetical protein ANCDUO_00624 [Ancylostoma duodenale]|uniref:Uncharacterized protein n=1 Tax=Ancylostoma duodenale TaxID=51022 RepID=A0A0C2DGD7_9BILA|nr:hypothetical protein ANCDUO_00624 [Ancylostoma duodenale]
MKIIKAGIEPRLRKRPIRVATTCSNKSIFLTKYELDMEDTRTPTPPTPLLSQVPRNNSSSVSKVAGVPTALDTHSTRGHAPPLILVAIGWMEDGASGASGVTAAALVLMLIEAGQDSVLIHALLKEASRALEMTSSCSLVWTTIAAYRLMEHGEVGLRGANARADAVSLFSLGLVHVTAHLLRLVAKSAVNQWMVNGLRGTSGQLVLVTVDWVREPGWLNLVEPLIM